ncbi:HDIG domain-containing protein [soil metagenome]
MFSFRKFFIAVSNKHDLYYRIVLITVSILVITAFLPQQTHFKYNFDKGNSWHYDNLRAPFDFPLYKNRKQIEEEVSQINTQSPVYFRKDTFAINRAFLEFGSLYQQGSNDGKIAGQMIIRSVYHQGLIDIPRNLSIAAGQPVYKLIGNVAEPTDLTLYLQSNQLAAKIERELIAMNLQGDGMLFNALVQSLKPDLIFDASLTEKNKLQYIESINPTHGMVKAGTSIIERGKIIGDRELEILESLKIAYDGDEVSRDSQTWLYIGYLILVCTAIIVLLTFLWLLRKDILLDSRKISLLFLLIVITCICYSMALNSNKLNMLLMPLCILPLVTRAFFDTRTALFTHVLTILILGTVAPGGFDFVYMQVITGMVAIFSIVNMRKRSQLFIAVGIIFIAYLFSYIGLSLLNEGSAVKVNYMNAVWLIGNCLLTLLSYPLIFFIEKTFGVTSDFTLMELTDFNSDLLRELATKTPGTFQHSLQVANLAESACYKIGGNSLLVRVGALYHDIGKTEIPMYFIENQSTQINPHDELSFDESASIIISHVIRGIEKAKKFNIPDIVIDFIRTHHGTLIVQYFYQSFLKNFPDEIADEDDFRYPGPKPFSKETAVLMMADSVEAAARSLPVHDTGSIDKLVESIINHQIENGQFENCDITYRDITSIKKIFKKMLSSIYHVRVAYPGN